MKNNSKLSVLYWICRAKQGKDGRVPIFARITIEGYGNAEISTRCKILPEFWCKKMKIDLSNTPEAKKTNKKLSEMLVDIDRLYQALQSQYTVIKPELVKMLYKAPNDSPEDHQSTEDTLVFHQVTLLEHTDNLLAKWQEEVDKGTRSGGTQRHWRSTRKKIKAFIKKKYKKEDIKLEDITPRFANDFLRYLTLEVNDVLAENTALKHIAKTKQVIGDAYDLKMIKDHPLLKFSCYCEDPEVMPLELHEVDSIYRHVFEIQRLDQARDGFIFQCFTGYAFQDIKALTMDHIIKVGANGTPWLIKKRGKTKVTEMVPIMPIVQELIKKYENHPCRKIYNLIMPIYSNTHYNGYLKEIADICGVSRVLKTHLARHTFADIIINVLGMSLEDLQQMLGHKVIRTTQKYVKVRKIRIERNMGKVLPILFTAEGKLREVVPDTFPSFFNQEVMKLY